MFPRLSRPRKFIRSMWFSALLRFGVAPLVLCGAAPLVSSDATISTFAGGAPQKTPVAAVSASVGAPTSVATDTAGDVFFTGDQCVFKMDPAGVLTRVAGNSRAGYAGDGGLGIDAQLNNPLAVAVDRAGNVFIADTNNFRIRKVGLDGIITTVAGTGVSGYTGDGGPALQAQIGEVVAIAVDSAGDLYLDDLFNAIRKVSAAGIITTVVTTNGPVVNGEPDLPMGLAADAAGNLYIADTYKLEVRRVSPNGTITVVAGNGTFGSTGDGGPATQAELNNPDAIATDAAGNLYIGSGLHFQVRKVAADGTISTVYAGDAQQGTSGESVGIAADASGNVYMTDYIRYGIRKYTPDGNWTIVAGDGNFSFSGDGGAATEAQLFLPSAIALDERGNAYIADTQNGRIRKVSPDGVISTYAGTGAYSDGGDGGTAVAAELSRPIGVAVDPSGNVYVTDANNSRIRKISTDGIIETIAGTESGGADLLRPWGLATDRAGNLFVADYGNNCVRKIAPNGGITIVAGTGVAGSGGVGGPAIAAQLTTPYGVAVDGAGDLFITDQAGYGRVVKVSADGTLTLAAGPGDIGGPPRNRQTTFVNGVAADLRGDAYFTDSYNYRVREITPDGKITTIAGNGSPGYSGDGGPGTAAMLLDPIGVAVDREGRVYIADSSNDAIRVLTPGRVCQGARCGAR